VEGAVGAVTSSDAGGPPDDGVRLPDQVTTRAVPLPEEAAAGDDGDRRAEAAAILRESEERIAGAVAGTAPGDAADENRPSDETV
jgi:hypothetical protein